LSLYHYRARMYDAVGERFASRDPIGFRGSKWSQFEYVSSSPLSHVDPTGEIKFPKAYIHASLKPKFRAKYEMRPCADIIYQVQRTTVVTAGFGYGADGSKHDALTHCIASCEIHHQSFLGRCNKDWDSSEIGPAQQGDKPSILDLINNEAGRTVRGDCASGCTQKLDDNELWCIPVGLIVNCHKK